MVKEDGSEEDFCSDCLSVVYNIDEYEPKYYQFQEITEAYYASESDKAKRIDY